MNCLGSGTCTFSLLPLELLHVELKLLTFQDVPDKIMPKNKIRWCKNKSTQTILRSNYQTHPSALPHWPGREDMQANNRPPPNCSSIWWSSVRTCTRFSIFLVRWLLFFVSSTVAPSASCLYKYAKNLVSLMNSKYAIDSTHSHSDKTQDPFVTDYGHGNVVLSVDFYITTFLFSLRASLLHFSDQDFSHNHNCSPCTEQENVSEKQWMQRKRK